MCQDVCGGDEDTHYLGRMDHLCQYCHAFHWLAEHLVRSAAGNAQYGSCCLQGKVNIDFVSPLLVEMYDLYTSLENTGKEFHSNFCQYNEVFAFTSMGGNFCLDSVVFDGHRPPMYKIQGEMFHQIGPLFLDSSHAPLYSQLYIYDPANTLQHCKDNNPRTCDSTMMTLQCIMLDCNPFIEVYLQAAALLCVTALPKY